MRILVAVPLHFQIPEKYLPAWHDLNIKIRDELGVDPEDESILVNQLIQQAEEKLEYLRIRPAFIEDVTTAEKERRDLIRAELKKIQEQEQQNKQLNNKDKA